MREVFHLNTVIYADELIFLNTIVNYFLILTAAFVSRAEFSRLRVLCGAFVGGISSMLIFLPQIHIVLSCLIKMLLSAIIVICSFKLKNARAFLRVYLTFFGANFIFAGAMLALCLAFADERIIYKSGAVYFDLSIITLVLVSTAIYIVVTAAARLFGRKAPVSHSGTASINVLGKSVSASAMIDTGNHLCDAFTGRPVIVADGELVKKLVPVELDAFFCGGKPEECVIPDGWSGRLRLIPYDTVNHKGLLPAFRCDTLLASCEGRTCERKNIFVGVSREPLSNGEYAVILGSDVFT